MRDLDRRSRAGPVGIVEQVLGVGVVEEGSLGRRRNRSGAGNKGFASDELLPGNETALEARGGNLNLVVARHKALDEIAAFAWRGIGIEIPSSAAVQRVGTEPADKLV